LNLGEEKMLSNGNIVAYTCPEARVALLSGEKQRRINPKIEGELVEFKEEIEKNFWQSEINQTYVFQRSLEPDILKTMKRGSQSSVNKSNVRSAGFSPKHDKSVPEPPKNTEEELVIIDQEQPSLKKDVEKEKKELTVVANNYVDVAKSGDTKSPQATN